MRTFTAIVGGFAKASRSLRVILAAWLLTFCIAMPLVLVMEETLRADIATSRVQTDLRGGLDLGWLEEFHHRHEGLARTLTPGRVSGVLALENLELWLNGDWLLENRHLATAAVAFLLLWILFQGGVIAHLAQSQARFTLGGFMGNAGAHFFRFLRIAAMLALGYYGIYRLAFWLFGAIERWTRDVTVEKTSLAFNLLAAVLIVALMTLIHLTADYARISTVRDGRKSMVLAICHSLFQVIRHPLQAFGVAGVFLFCLLLLQALLVVAMPDARNASLQSLLIAFILGQLYLLMRTALRVARYGAEITLYDQWRGE